MKLRSKSVLAIVAAQQALAIAYVLEALELGCNLEENEIAGFSKESWQGEDGLETTMEDLIRQAVRALKELEQP